MEYIFNIQLPQNKLVRRSSVKLWHCCMVTMFFFFLHSLKITYQAHLTHSCLISLQTLPVSPLFLLSPHSPFKIFPLLSYYLFVSPRCFLLSFFFFFSSFSSVSSSKPSFIRPVYFPLPFPVPLPMRRRR